MKKIILFSCLFFVAIFSFCQQDSVRISPPHDQQDSAISVPPYLRFPTVPPFKLLEVDSSSYFAKKDLKKNEPVLIMLFNPDCDHCKHETEEIIKNIDQLKDVRIVMATMMPFDMMKSFYEKYDLQRFENIIVGEDFQYTLSSFYQIHFMPYLAMYNKKGNLLSTFEGSMKIEDLINVFK